MNDFGVTDVFILFSCIHTHSDGVGLTTGGTEGKHRSRQQVLKALNTMLEFPLLHCFSPAPAIMYNAVIFLEYQRTSPFTSLPRYVGDVEHLVVLSRRGGRGIGCAVLALKTQVLVNPELAGARVAGSEDGKSDDDTYI